MVGKKIRYKYPEQYGSQEGEAIILDKLNGLSPFMKLEKRETKTRGQLDVSKTSIKTRASITTYLVQNTESGEIFQILPEFVKEIKGEGIEAREEQYTKTHLVKFGNYLLSEEREKKVDKRLKRVVTDADIDNAILE